ncbi:MAG: hypothetical protein GXX93_02165, partial [Anaerolineae bacterium]|nr:hypothetical protein [Anaerolineae bacterium]
PRQRLGRLNPGGSLDTTLVDPGINAQVLAIAVQPDGKILLGGSFTNVAGKIRNHIARLNPDGTLDEAFSPSAAGPVQALVLQPDGKILLGGRYTSGGLPYLVRLNPDGSMDTDIDVSADGPVLALALQPDGKILVGFQVENDASESVLIARLNADGSSDAGFQPVLKQGAHYVWSLVLQPDGKILAGGYYFESGIQRGYIARLNPDGSPDDTFNSGADGGVLKLALQPDGKIVVAGWFAALAGGERSRIGRLNPDGSLDNAFDPGANGAIAAVALQSDGNILVGGGFTTLGGQPRQNIGRLNPDGSPDTTLHAIADGSVQAIALQPDGKILVGGYFFHLGGQARPNFGRFLPDGTLDTGFNAQANAMVYAIALQPDGKIIVGGTFSALGGEARNRIGRLNPDGTLDTTFNSGANGAVYGLAVQPDGKILVAGAFRTLGTETREYIGRLNPDGTVDTTFNAQADGTVHAIALQPDGKIIVGGRFSTLGGEEFANLGFGRLNPDGSVDPSLGAVFASYSDTAYAITLQPDGKIIVGGSSTPWPESRTTITSAGSIPTAPWTRRSPRMPLTLSARWCCNPTARSSSVASSIVSEATSPHKRSASTSDGLRPMARWTRASTPGLLGTSWHWPLSPTARSSPAGSSSSSAGSRVAESAGSRQTPRPCSTWPSRPMPPRSPGGAAAPARSCGEPPSSYPPMASPTHPSGRAHASPAAGAWTACRFPWARASSCGRVASMPVVTRTVPALSWNRCVTPTSSPRPPRSPAPLPPRSPSEARAPSR